MPAPRPQSRLSLLTFPQRWHNGAVDVRFLCLPKGDPGQPLGPGMPPFSAANMVFRAQLIGSLDQLPRAADATSIGPVTLDSDFSNKAALLSELTSQFQIVSRPQQPPAGMPSFRKPVTESYRALTGDRELSSFITSNDVFDCALHDGHSRQPTAPVTLDSSITWARVIAFVMKQPALALACGFIGKATVTLPDPDFFEDGGWLYLDLDAGSDYAAAIPGFTSLYAARIPAVTADRPLYASVLFPVDGAEPVDDVYREAEQYSFGFARMVHGAQTDDHGDAIQLAWDDEHVAEIFNRQVDASCDAPMGTCGYRIDVRQTGDIAWNSLQQIESTDDLKLGLIPFGKFQGDAVVEVNPVQLSAASAGEYWMPPYFTTWRGSSLALTDQQLVDLHQNSDLDAPGPQTHRLGRDKVFAPVNDQLVPLRYGNSYDFRVRLADLTYGGPAADDDLPLSSDSIATIDFRRRTRPAQVPVVARPSKDAPRLTLAKPRLGYPNAMFTGKVNFSDLSDDFLSKPEREFSVPDPDVIALDILVEVRAQVGDSASWLPLYTTQRSFAEDTITIDLDPQDHATLDDFAEVQPGDGALAIPTARDMRFTLTAMGRTEANYFDSPETRKGISTAVQVRAAAIAEPNLLNLLDPPVVGFFFQPTPTDGSVASPVERLAQELDVNVSRLTVSGPAGHRTIFGSSAELHHTLATDGSSATFASNADLAHRWVNVVQFTIARDWTWDGLADVGLAVRRIVKRPLKDDLDQLAGHIQIARSVSPSALTDGKTDPRDPQRQFTNIVFFDAFDPKPAQGEFPSETTFAYQITAIYKDGVIAPDPVLLPGLLVPITTPPAQVPKLVSAGIALSEFVSAIDYSSTQHRARSLWMEFEEAPADLNDTYFIRILAAAPDPMLTALTVPEITEAALPMDPEWMRMIVPGQPRDRNGLNAMDLLAQNSPDNKHWIVPLPEGLDVSSPELFGMYTYEIRIGHTDARWSTAQGRFGAPLRIAGVKHPTPPLVCQAARVKGIVKNISGDVIRIRAPFATPVYQGRNVRPLAPRTELWAILYARVRQTDGASWRNLMLARQQLQPPSSIFNAGPESNAAVLFGEGSFDLNQIKQSLRLIGLSEDAPLTTLAVEFFNSNVATNPPPDPLGADLGFGQVLRISPLAPVPDAC